MWTPATGACTHGAGVGGGQPASSSPRSPTASPLTLTQPELQPLPHPASCCGDGAMPTGAVGPPSLSRNWEPPSPSACCCRSPGQERLLFLPPSRVLQVPPLHQGQAGTRMQHLSAMVRVPASCPKRQRMGHGAGGGGQMTGTERVWSFLGPETVKQRLK